MLSLIFSMIPKNLILVEQPYRFGDRNYFMGHSRVVLLWFSGHVGLSPLYMTSWMTVIFGIRTFFLWYMVIRRGVSGNNHFQFAMLLLTECFFPQRSKCINSHWSLRWSSIYLFSQKSSPFTSKVASTNSNSSRKPQENSRLKNARSILNDPSFSRLWGSFLLTLFLGFFVFFISSFISSLWGTSILLSIRSSCLQAGQLCVPSLLPGSKASFDAHILTLNLCEFWGSQAPCSYWAHGIQLGSWLFGEMEMEDIHHFDGEKIYSRKLHLGKTATKIR